MTRIGFHASHEQIGPRQLLADVQHAARVGFDMAMCSEHFVPWSSAHGHAGNTWAWLGAALATTDLAIGCVCTPGYRNHPAVLAQQLATLGEMFPGRIWTALASGEAKNETITGARWPRKEQRVERLEECVDVIRRLLDGDEVTHEGHVHVEHARLWEVPEVQPLLIGPAISPESAGRVAAWADGLVTVNQDLDTLREVLERYGEAGGRGRRALQLHLSWAPTQAEAEEIAFDQWRSNVFGGGLLADIDKVEAFDTLAEFATKDAVADNVRISADLNQHAAWIHEYLELGFDDVYLHHVGQEQAAFLDAAGEHLLPQLR